MIQLISQYDGVIKDKNATIWVVMLSFYGEPEQNIVKLFISYTVAKTYFMSLMPDEKDILKSETLRCRQLQIDKTASDYIHSKQYFVDNNYYENWDYYEQINDIAMTYYIELIKVGINNKLR